MNKLMSRLVLLSTLCGFYTASANALVVDAEIKPDPSNPGSAVIINNTPITGYCANPIFSSRCNIAKIRSNEFPITLTWPGIFNTSDVIPFGIDARWRTFTVTHNSIPGETAEIQIRIGGVGTRYTMGETAQTLVGQPGLSDFEAHAYLWTPSWSEKTGNCTKVAGSEQTAAHDGRSFSAFWATNEIVDTCPRDADRNIPGLVLQKLDVHYELRAVRPERLISGGYQGSVHYTVGGPGSDFNMGSLNPSQSMMTFDLNLAVKQDVKVEMSTDRVSLAPKGGWMDWINHGRQNEKLLADLRFFILSSTPFKMELGCERLAGNRCEISNGTHQVPVDISVSLPSPWVDDVGNTVERRSLNADTGIPHIKSLGVPNRNPSLLHFEVPASEVEHMVSDSSYRGTVTIKFDADI